MGEQQGGLLGQGPQHGCSVPSPTLTLTSHELGLPNHIQGLIFLSLFPPALCLLGPWAADLMVLLRPECPLKIKMSGVLHPEILIL